MAEFHPELGFFTAYRKKYGFPYFDREEPLELFREMGLWGAGIIYIIVVLVITVIIAFLGTRGYSRWRVTLQMIITLSIGCSIIVCVTGNFWRVAHYEQTDGNRVLKYKLHIGLHQANITMARMMEGGTDYLEYHNVKIGWTEVSQAEREYREGLMRGWPPGILRIARYISVDMGEMRYMRKFRESGYAVYVLLWAAFASWLLANILIGSHVTYAACALLLTGILKLLACIVYASRQPARLCQEGTGFCIPMDDEERKQLSLNYDWMYWLTLFLGIFIILISVIILVLDYLRPADMNKFFGTSSEYVSACDEAELIQNQNKDIRGIIRSLSTKRSIRREKEKLPSDVEKTKKKAPFDSYHSNEGGTLPPYTSSPTDRQTGNGITVPDVQVEMMPIDGAEHRQRIPNHDDLDEKDEIDTDSETDCDKQHENIYQLDASSMFMEDDSGLRPRSGISSLSSSTQQLVPDH